MEEYSQSSSSMNERARVSSSCQRSRPRGALLRPRATTILLRYPSLAAHRTLASSTALTLANRASSSSSTSRAASVSASVFVQAQCQMNLYCRKVNSWPAAKATCSRLPFFPPTFRLCRHGLFMHS